MRGRKDEAMIDGHRNNGITHDTVRYEDKGDDRIIDLRRERRQG